MYNERPINSGKKKKILMVYMKQKAKGKIQISNRKNISKIHKSPFGSQILFHGIFLHS